MRNPRAIARRESDLTPLSFGCVELCRCQRCSRASRTFLSFCQMTIFLHSEARDHLFAAGDFLLPGLRMVSKCDLGRPESLQYLSRRTWNVQSTSVRQFNPHTPLSAIATSFLIPRSWIISALSRDCVASVLWYMGVSTQLPSPHSAHAMRGSCDLYVSDESRCFDPCGSTDGLWK